MTSIYDSGIDYDALAIGHNAGDEAAFYASYVPPAGSALEFACGTGRLTVPLAERGLSVIGLDNSLAMLTTAEVKAAGRGVTPSFILGDMREFDLGTQFDLIFLPSNSLGHLHTLPDIRACFASALRHLAPQGRFVLNMFSPSLRLLQREPDTPYPITEYTRPDGKTVTVTETVSYDAATQINHSLWHYNTGGGPEEVRPLDLRVFFPQELDALLLLSGFAIEAKYGGFDKSAFTGTSRQQVVVCRAS